MITSRNLRTGTCPDCGADVLTGLDADWCGLPVTLDKQPVDELGEALAVLTARRTYDVRSRGGRSHSREMEERNVIRMRQRRYWPVHAVHVCGQPLPTPPPVDQPTAVEAQLIDDGRPF
jgi:hypothetical protein